MCSWVNIYCCPWNNISIQKFNLDHFPKPKPNLTRVITKIRGNYWWMTLIYKQQTLIVSLNFTKTTDLFFKSDWLITMLFQGQQRCWPRNMSHLVKSGSASSTLLKHVMFQWDFTQSELNKRQKTRQMHIVSHGWNLWYEIYHLMLS